MNRDGNARATYAWLLSKKAGICSTILSTTKSKAAIIAKVRWPCGSIPHCGFYFHHRRRNTCGGGRLGCRSVNAGGTPATTEASPSDWWLRRIGRERVTTRKGGWGWRGGRRRGGLDRR